MIVLNRHIEVLLLSNDCVIVPDFGGFVTHYISARFDEADNIFLPPLRTLGFNSQLKLNDHLLAQSYVETYDISYPEAMRRIADEVAEIKQTIENDGQYELSGMGTLLLNDEGSYEFSPCESGILTPVFYGLSSISIHRLDVNQTASATTVGSTTAKTVNMTNYHETSDHQQDFKSAPHVDDDVVVVKMSFIRKTVAIAAAIILFFMIGSPTQHKELDTIVQQSSVLPINTAAMPTNDSVRQTASLGNTIEAHKDVMKPLEDRKEEKAVAKEHLYTIILASQTPRNHAEEFIARLNKQDISDVRILPMDNTDRVRVAYRQFTTESEAQKSLHTLRGISSEFAEAWILRIK